MSEKKYQDQVLNAVYEMEEALEKAMHLGFSNDSRIVSYRTFKEHLEWIRKSLPESLTKAEDVLRSQETAMQRAKANADQLIATAKSQAEQERSRVNAEVVTAQQRLAHLQNQLSTAHADADRQAQQRLIDAQNPANQMLQQAQQEVQRMLQQADMQAKSIIQQANAEAEQLRSQEQVYMRAQVDAERLRSDTEGQMKTLRQNTYQYVDSMLAQLENYATAIMGDVRQERDNLHGHM